MDMIGAEVPGYGYDDDIVGCFDPRIVIARLHRAFPDMTMDALDYSRRDQAGFLWRLGEKGPRVAEADAIRRGPLWMFQIPVETTVLEGKVERYAVLVTGRPKIPEPARTTLLNLFITLKFAPYVVIHESTPEVFRNVDDEPVVRPPFWPTLPRLSLVVLRSKDIKLSAKFYECFGLSMKLERHESGPEHYSAILGPSVIEIYPLGTGSATTSTRIGLDVASISRALASLRDEGLLPANTPERREHEHECIIADPDGHRVHLVEVQIPNDRMAPDWVTSKS